jgi:hypothetical protein
VRALRQGVNTGVGTSRTVDAYNSARDAPKRALEMILHSVAMRLALPAGERCTVISNKEPQTPFFIWTVRCGMRPTRHSGPSCMALILDHKSLIAVRLR